MNTLIFTIVHVLLQFFVIPVIIIYKESNIENHPMFPFQELLHPENPFCSFEIIWYRFNYYRLIPIIPSKTNANELFLYSTMIT